MAAPVDAGRAVTNISTAVTSWSVNLPASIAAGNILVMLVRTGAASTHTLPTGWNWLIQNDTADGSTQTTSVMYKVATGSEGATLTYDPGGSQKGAAIVTRITGGSSSITPDVSIATGTTGTNVINPPSRAVTGGPKDVLVLALGGMDAETSTPSAAPTNYSNLQTANSGTAGSVASNTIICSATRGLTNVSTEDPGAFTHAAVNSGWTGITVVVHVAAAATTWDGAATISFTMTPAASGAKELNGSVSALSFAMATAVSGRKELNGSAGTISFTMTPAASGVKEKVGSASLSFAMTPVASGIRTADGTASISFTMTPAVAGTREKLGAATTTFSFSLAAAGDVVVYIVGTVNTISFSMTTTAAGVREKVGSASTSFAFTTTATGERTATGAATIAFSMPVVVSSVREKVGAATTTFSMTTAASGRREALGAATTTFSFATTVQSNIDHRFNSAALAFSFSIVAESDTQGEKLGAATVSMNFTIAATGQRTTFGTATIPVAFTTSAVGQRDAIAAVTPIAVAFAVAAAAQRIVNASAGLTFSMSVAASGVRESLGTVDGEVTLSFTFSTVATAQAQNFPAVSRTRLGWRPLLGIRTQFGAHRITAPKEEQGAKLPNNPNDQPGAGASNAGRGFLHRQGAQRDKTGR